VRTDAEEYRRGIGSGISLRQRARIL